MYIYYLYQCSVLGAPRSIPPPNQLASQDHPPFRLSKLIGPPSSQLSPITPHSRSLQSIQKTLRFTHAQNQSHPHSQNTTNFTIIIKLIDKKIIIIILF